MKENRPGVFEVMKYIVAAAAAAFVTVLMIFSSASSRPFEDVEEAVEQVVAGENMIRMDGQMLKRNFGLNSADYDGVLYYSSESGMSAEEVLLIKVKNDSQIQKVTDAVSARIEQRSSDFDGYAPEEVKLLQDAQSSVRGRYIFFAAAPQAGEYKAAFDRSL